MQDWISPILCRTEVLMVKIRLVDKKKKTEKLEGHTLLLTVCPYTLHIPPYLSSYTQQYAPDPFCFIRKWPVRESSGSSRKKPKHV
jgi:hypothetical protein